MLQISIKDVCQTMKIEISIITQLQCYKQTTDINAHQVLRKKNDKMVSADKKKKQIISLSEKHAENPWGLALQILEECS